MNAENGRMFRSALSGYHKEDVNRYILDTDTKHREAMEKLNQDIEDMGKINLQLAEKNERLESENKEKTEKASALEAELARLREENRNQAASLQDLTKKHDFFKAQTEAQNEVITKLREEKAALGSSLEASRKETQGKEEQLRAATEKYTADLETLRNAYEAEMQKIKDDAKPDDGVAYKLDMYDKISSQIGDILINANRNSDEIISTAKDEAEKLRQRTGEMMEQEKAAFDTQMEEQKKAAEARARRINEGLSASADLTLSHIKGDFAANTGSCVKDLQIYLSEIQSETNTMLAFLRQKQEEMNDRIDFYSTSISDNVEERLAQLDAVSTDMILTSNDEGETGAAV